MTKRNNRHPWQKLGRQSWSLRKAAWVRRHPSIGLESLGQMAAASYWRSEGTVEGEAMLALHSARRYYILDIVDDWKSYAKQEVRANLTDASELAEAEAIIDGAITPYEHEMADAERRQNLAELRRHGLGLELEIDEEDRS